MNDVEKVSGNDTFFFTSMKFIKEYGDVVVADLRSRVNINTFVVGINVLLLLLTYAAMVIVV